MTRIARITVFAVLFCAWSGHNAQEPDDGSCSGYGFGEEQEQQWGECWPLCNGDNQSPIDIEDNDVTTVDLPYINGSFLQDSYIPYHFNLSNENYTVTLQLVDADHLYMEGGPLYGRYLVHHLQFCWGSDDSKGSDHTLNGVRYPMESQWGLYSEQYASYEEASEHPGGVLRITQLYPIQEEDNPSMAAIVRALPDVVQPGQVTTPNETLTYDELLSGYPADDYFHYNGSFTTPPCSETVMWLVYPPLHGISEQQVAAFRNLQSTDGPLVNNFRQTQPLNGRKVIRSDKSTPDPGECETSTSTTTSTTSSSTTTSSERRLAAKRHQAIKSGRRGRHGASKRHGTARRRHH